MDIIWRVMSWEGEGEEQGKRCKVLRSTIWWVQNRQGDAKNSIENGKAKELKCMTHGHEIRGKALPEGMGVLVRGEQRGNIGTTVIA